MSLAEWNRTVFITVFFSALAAVKLLYVEKRLK